LRSKFEEQGLQLLQQTTQNSAVAQEIFNATVKRLARRKLGLKTRNKLIPKGAELKIY
jgi:hypothetical protein